MDDPLWHSTDRRLFRKIQFESSFLSFFFWLQQKVRIRNVAKSLSQKHFNEWNFFVATAITRGSTEARFVSFRYVRRAACTIKLICVCCYKFYYFVKSMFVLLFFCFVFVLLFEIFCTLCYLVTIVIALPCKCKYV